MEIGTLLDDYKVGEAMVCQDLKNVGFFNDPENGINIIHVNIRSIYKNFDQFLVFLESLNATFDVIVMSESHFLVNEADFNIPEYVIAFNGSKLNRCDGCCAYIKKDVYVSHQVVVEEDLNILKLTLQKNAILIDIFATYKGFGLSKDMFINNLNSILQRALSDSNRICVFTGDVNIDLLRIDEDATNDYLTMMLSHGFNSLINKPTRKTETAKSCLDHLFVKCRGDIFKLGYFGQLAYRP